MIGTSIAQSKRLLGLGISPDTADVFIPSYGGENYAEDRPYLREHTVRPDKGDLPCWSLTVLLSLLPHVRIDSEVFKWRMTPHFGGTAVEYAESDTGRVLVRFEEDTPIDAVFAMVVWAVEKGYLDTHGDERKVEMVERPVADEHCSQELCWLLRKKGFDSETDYVYYHYEEDGGWCFEKLMPSDKFDGGKMLRCPTHQMAMRWLRERHGMSVMVDCVGSKNYDPMVQCFDGRDYAVEGKVVLVDGKRRRGFPTYEEACEEAMKYCLKNLI